MDCRFFFRNKLDFGRVYLVILGEATNIEKLVTYFLKSGVKPYQVRSPVHTAIIQEMAGATHDANQVGIITPYEGQRVTFWDSEDIKHFWPCSQLGRQSFQARPRYSHLPNNDWVCCVILWHLICWGLHLLCAAATDLLQSQGSQEL